MRTFHITIVNHVSIRIARPPLPVWETITDDYVHGRRFARAGYRIDRIADDPACPLGSYRMRIADGGSVDDRICRLTELDHEAMRLSLHADFSTTQGRYMSTFATYQAIAAGANTLYRLDCHSTLDHAVPRDASDEDIARSIAARQAEFDLGLKSRLRVIRAELEAGDKPDAVQHGDETC